MNGLEKHGHHTFQLQVMSKSKMSTDKNTNEEEMIIRRRGSGQWR